MFHPGKYRDNELITLLPSNKSTSGMFAIRTKKLRERIDSAVMQANHAAQVALEKTDIATARCVSSSRRPVCLLNTVSLSCVTFHWCSRPCIVLQRR